MTERDIADGDSWRRDGARDAAGPLVMHGLQPQRAGARPGPATVPRAAAPAHGMACDQELAGRIRRLTGSDPDLTENKMPGGLAFLIRGTMAIAASSQGGAMLRAGPRQSAALVAASAARVMQMRGRPMPG